MEGRCLNWHRLFYYREELEVLTKEKVYSFSVFDYFGGRIKREDEI